MGLKLATMAAHRKMTGGKEDKNIYCGDSDDEWGSCLSHADLSLIDATKKGDLDKVIQLVLSGTTSLPCRNIAARMASARGLKDIMAFLFQQRRADTTSRSKRGFTPLKLARLYQNQDAIDYLLNTLHVLDEDEIERKLRDDFEANEADADTETEDSPEGVFHAERSPKSVRPVSGRDPVTPQQVPKGMNFLHEFSPQLIDLDSPDLSPRSHPSSSSLASTAASSLYTTRKPISRANRNASRSNPAGSFQPYRSFEDSKASEDELEFDANQSMTFVSKKPSEEEKEPAALASSKPSISSTKSKMSTPTSVQASVSSKPELSSSPPSIDLSSFVTSSAAPPAPAFFSSDDSGVPVAPPMFEANGIPVPPPLGGVPGAPPLAPGLSSSSTLTNRHSKFKPSKPLKPLHWDLLPSSSNSNSNTLWSELAKDAGEDDESTLEHATELESLFSKKVAMPLSSSKSAAANSANSAGSGGAAANSNASKKSTGGTVIDMKRSTNIEIAMKKFRMSWDQIRRAILKVDLEQLNAERIQALVQCLPTPEESKQLQTLVDSLTKQGSKPVPLAADTKPSQASSISTAPPAEPNVGYPELNYAENFFVVLSSIPRCSTRLKLLAFKLKFAGAVQDCESSIAVLNDAASQIKQSKSLKKVFDVILTIGNYLNSGTNKGSANGFRLTSLQLLESTKSNDGKTSLLDYVTKFLDDRFVFLTTNSKGKARQRESTVLSQSAKNSESESERSESEANELSASPASTTALLTAAINGPSLPSFLADLSLVKDASIIDVGHVERELSRMESNLKLVNIQLAHAPQSPTTRQQHQDDETGSAETTDIDSAEEDNFHSVMSAFYHSSLARLKTLQSSFSSTQSLIKELMQYFGEDSSRMEITVFFELFAKFGESYRRAENNTRQQRAKEAREKLRSITAAGKSHANAKKAVASTSAPAQDASSAVSSEGEDAESTRSAASEGLSKRRK